MATYKIEIETNGADAPILRVGFGDPAENNEIVRDATARLDELKKTGQMAGGPLILINGPASLPVACAIAHAISHLYGSVGVFDPKLNGYVIAVAHGGKHAVGDLIPA